MENPEIEHLSNKLILVTNQLVKLLKFPKENLNQILTRIKLIELYTLRLREFIYNE